jgi:hypothetical protein
VLRLLHYYSKYQSARGAFGGLPGWARVILLVAALPGLALALLSILAFGVSLLALLLLVVPVYRLLRALVGSEREPVATVGTAPLGQVDFVEPAEPVAPSTDASVKTTVSEPAVELTPAPPRRQIEVRIVE